MRKSWIDTLWVSTVNILQLLVMTLLFLRIANILGAESYGVYVFSMSIGMFALLFDGFGGEQTLVMFGSRNEKDIPSLFGNALLLRLLLLLPTLLGSYIISVCYNFSKEHTFWYMIIVLTAIIAGLANPFFLSYYRIMGKVRMPWILRLMCSCGFLIYIYTLNNDNISLGRVVLGYFASTIALVLFFSIDVFRKIKIKIDLPHFIKKLKYNYFFLSTKVVDLLFAKIDVFVLQAIKGEIILGVYSLGYKIAGLMIAFPSAMHMVMLPLFHKNAHNPKELMKLFYQARRLMIELSAFVLGYLAYNGIRPFLPFVTEEYHKGSSVVSIISIYTALNFIAYPYAMLAEAKNLLKEKIYGRIWSIVVTGLAIVPMIYLFGMTGSALAVTFGMFSFLMILHFKVNTVEEKFAEGLSTLSPFALTVLAGIGEYFLRVCFPTGVLGIIISVAVYSVFFVIIGNLSGTLIYLNIRFIKDIIAKKEMV